MKFKKETGLYLVESMVKCVMFLKKLYQFGLPYSKYLYEWNLPAKKKKNMVSCSSNTDMFHCSSNSENI